MASLWCVSHWADPDAQYDSRMNPNEVSAFRSNSVVEMTVFATVSSRARLACPGLRVGQLTIEWE